MLVSCIILRTIPINEMSCMIRAIKINGKIINFLSNSIPVRFLVLSDSTKYLFIKAITLVLLKLKRFNYNENITLDKYIKFYIKVTDTHISIKITGNLS